MKGLTAAWGKLEWLLIPFLATTARKLGVEFSVLEGIEHPANFSRKLIEWLQTAPEVFLWSCVDTFIDCDVRPEILDSLGRYMVQRGDIVRMGIAREGWPFEVIDRWDGMNIVRCADNTQCSIHAGAVIDTCLFHSKNLLKILQPGWTLWDIEVLGTEKILHDPSLVSLSIKPGLFIRSDISCHAGFLWHSDQLQKEELSLINQAMPAGVNWKL